MKYREFKARQHWYRNVYLLSEHWDKLRESKLKINPCCELCGKKKRLDVHHVRYKNIYDVTVEDLQTLCRTCHRKFHKKKNQNKLRQFIKFRRKHKRLV